jgi:hypothetical protein
MAVRHVVTAQNKTLDEAAQWLNAQPGTHITPIGAHGAEVLGVLSFQLVNPRPRAMGALSNPQVEPTVYDVIALLEAEAQ